MKENNIFVQDQILFSLSNIQIKDDEMPLVRIQGHEPFTEF